MHLLLARPRIILHIHSRTRTLIDLMGILTTQDRIRIAVILPIITLTRIRTLRICTLIITISQVSQLVVRVQPRCLSSHIRKIPQVPPSNMRIIITPMCTITIILMDGASMAVRVRVPLWPRLVRRVRIWEDLHCLQKADRQDTIMNWTG